MNHSEISQVVHHKIKLVVVVNDSFDMSNCFHNNKINQTFKLSILRNPHKKAHSHQKYKLFNPTLLNLTNLKHNK